MQSIAYIPGSNGAGNASQMTVQNVRSPGASDILVNTVTGVPTKFYGSMGAPHTFVDPVTSEVITLISEATAVDFAGHVDSGKLVIDAIAPGYVDTRGSLVGDIVVIRPITEWANNLFNVLSQSHKDDGSFKDNSITDNAPFADPVDPVLRGNESIYDFISSGGAWSVVTGLSGAMSALVGYITGYRSTVAAIATRTFTINKDTYVDVLRTTTSGVTTFSIVYTEVANGAVAPALAANSVRLARVVTNGSAITGILQGGIDGIGNLFYPRRIGLKTIDANGWKVYEMGGFRRYIKRFGPAYPTPGLVGAGVINGPIGEFSNQALPVGIPNIGTAEDLRWTWGALSGGDVMLVTVNGTDMANKTSTPDYYVRNTAGGGVNFQYVRLSIEIIT